MKLIKLSDAVEEILFQQEQMNTFCTNLQNRQVCWETSEELVQTIEAIQNNANSHFTVIKEELETQVQQLETIDEFAKRLQLESSSIHRLIEENKVQTINLIPTTQWQNLSSEEIKKILQGM